MASGSRASSTPGRTPGSQVFGRDVDAIYYVHVTEGPRVHPFELRGVMMEALPDGSIRIWHPDARLWEDLP